MLGISCGQFSLSWFSNYVSLLSRYMYINAVGLNLLLPLNQVSSDGGINPIRGSVRHEQVMDEKYQKKDSNTYTHMKTRNLRGLPQNKS